MFEKYNFAGLFIQIQAVLTLYAQGAYRDELRLNFCFSVGFCSLLYKTRPCTWKPYKFQGFAIYTSYVICAHLIGMTNLCTLIACYLTFSYFFLGLLTGLVIDSGDGVTHVVITYLFLTLRMGLCSISFY